MNVEVPGQRSGDLTWFFMIIFGMIVVGIVSAAILSPQLLPQVSLRFIELFKKRKRKFKNLNLDYH